MFFTQDDFRKIEEYLKLNSRKDSDFDEVFQIKPQDKVAIVQEATNKSINIGTLIKTGMLPKSIDQSKLDDDVINRFIDTESNVTHLQEQLGQLSSTDQSIAEIIEALMQQINSTSEYQHVVITKERYDALPIKEKHTLYLIVDSVDGNWVLGDSLPIILS